ncbi:MAG TPA: hypothetical protein ENI82_00420 [Bacteroidetes bacterium]|nr:hypothetical protein [Bacteroidota bacterium]
MKTFRIFFGLSIGIILFLFVAKIFFFAFVAAAIMSIIYAVFSRVKRLITYGQNGEHYMQRHNFNPGYINNRNDEVEPLFVDNMSGSRRTINNIKFIEAI